MCLLVCLAQSAFAQSTPPPSPSWPHPVPCRIEDGTNKDILVTTLGDVQTPLSQGVFDPVKDEVVLKDGTVKEHYYRDTLHIKYYQPLDKTRFPLPPSGWCTWYYYYSQVTEDEVKLNARWIVDNLKDYGAQYVQIDDGWQGSGALDGKRDWTTVRQTFPDGIGNLAAYIISLGLTPGLWLAPHGQSSLAVVTNHPDVFLRKADGTLDASPSRWEGNYLVDPSTPESLQYMNDLFARLSQQGFEYFKIDGQPGVVDEYRTKAKLMKNPSDDTDGLYRKTIESIRSAIGPDRYLLGCWGIPEEGIGIMNGSRSGGDIVGGWSGFLVALRATLPFYFLHNIAWYGDPDVVLVRSPLTLDQARAWAALQGLTGQAVMSSDRLVDLSEDRVELLKRIYPAVDIRPLDLYPTDGTKRIWDLKVNHLGRQYDVVGVFNFDEGRNEQALLKWGDLGLAAGQAVHVFDFWNQEYLGQWKEGFKVTAAPTSCRLLTLVPADGAIQLVSTSRHITQGWVDLTALSHDETGRSWKGTSKVVKNDPYELRFAFPRGTNYSVKEVTARGPSGKLAATVFNHQGWAAVKMTSPENGKVNWEVQFETNIYFHYPVAAPNNLWIERVGLDGANLHWGAEYYLNEGYQVYLDGALLGHSPDTEFPIRGLNAKSNYTAEVRSVWEDGREAGNATSRLDFTLARTLPAELSLTELEPVRSTGRWRGFEADEVLTGAPLSVGSKINLHGLSSFADSEAEYDIKGIYHHFNALAGVDRASTGAGEIDFVVEADGVERWRSGPLKKSDEAKRVSIDINGVNKLVLRAISRAGGPRSRDQADWLDPKLTQDGTRAGN